MTLNLRSWRNFFQLRTAKAAHPQMRQLAVPLLEEFKQRLPDVFDDITVNTNLDSDELNHNLKTTILKREFYYIKLQLGEFPHNKIFLNKIENVQLAITKTDRIKTIYFNFKDSYMDRYDYDL